MLNETILKFGYPKTLLKEYDNWVVLLRPEQISAGCMILACKGEATRMSDVSAAAFSELPQVTGDIEQTLQKVFKFEKINYILLMMVDKYVHFHVIPRYSTSREAAGVIFHDSGWPKFPNMAAIVDMNSDEFLQFVKLLRSNWP
jgi:diadenosine tetraphosphate (Ap4A) HIT family hydrolase